MQPGDPTLIRPRTTGEILDDAWGLAFADFSRLLLLSALFTLPAATCLLLLLVRPRPETFLAGAWLPALTATLLVLTGLGSGACQELFRRRAEGQPIGVGGCLAAALWRGPGHITARALVLGGTLLLSPCLLLPGLAIWAGGSTLHAVLAEGSGRLFEALRTVGRDLPRQSGKAAAVTFIRLPLLLLAVLNLLLLGSLVLEIAGELGGLDTALLSAILFLDNPVYVAALAVVAWVLLAPYTEAANYLLHVDTRARYEGLDLWYRVRRLFPVRPASRGPETPDQPARPARQQAALPLALLLGLGGLFGVGQPAAAGEQLDKVRQARAGVETIRREAASADPYPGGQRWAPRLRNLARDLDPAGKASKGSYRWFFQAADDFAREADQKAGLAILAELERRLALLEESLAPPAGEGQPGGKRLGREEIKRLLPGRADLADDEGPKKKEEKKEPVRREDEDVEAPGRAGPRGPGIVGPVGAGPGLGGLLWVLLIGAVLVVVVLGALLIWQNWEPRKKPPVQKGQTPEEKKDPLAHPDLQKPQALWRQAEEFARQGDYLNGVRALYLAALATLHRAGLIYYEPIRTNGEYQQQVRLKPEAPEELHEVFRRLTDLFELKWYGERACAAGDYEVCRGLAEEIRDRVGGRN
jgi:hypothetical protein